MFAVFLSFATIGLGAYPVEAQSARSVGKYQTIEIPVPHSQNGVANVWEDVSVIAELTAPDRSIRPIGGFYHSTDLWMVRFVPDQTGVWKYKIAVNGSQIIQDSFLCVASNEPGFIYPDIEHFNPKELVYSGSGQRFHGIGFGDCITTPRDSILEFGGIDGGYRPHGYHNGIEWNMPYLQYLIAYGDAAGFNLYRYSDGNCAYSMVNQLTHSGNDYDALHSRWTDTLFYALRQHGFRIYMTILASPAGNSSDTAAVSAVERYAQYCIDRFGSIVDFWELTNESTPDSAWTSTVAQYIQSHDPYNHAISVSWEQPKNPQINIISPHWYGKEDVKTSDQVTADRINQYSQIAKPVIFGEQGEVGWDSLSGMRMRGRIWSALFNAGTIIFWNSSFAKDCPCNQYLGWEERRYVRVMNNFSQKLHSNLRQITDPLVAPHTIGPFKIWGLSSYDQLALYIRNDVNVDTINSGLNVPVNLPYGGEVIFYDVHSGDILKRTAVQSGPQTLAVPPFQTDIAVVAGSVGSGPIVDSMFRLDVNPRTFEAIGVPVNTDLTFSVQLKNIGSTTIAIDGIFPSSSSPKFKFTTTSILDPFTLAPGQSIPFTIGYRMLDTGGAAAMFSFRQSNSPAWENVAIDVAAIEKLGVAANPDAASLRVFPDPANNVLRMELGQRNATIETIELFNSTGVLILEQEFKLSDEMTIDVSHIASGDYKLILLDGRKILNSRSISVIH